MNHKSYYEFNLITGVGMVLRKMGGTVSPTVELSKDGDEFTLSTTSTFKSTVIKFKLGAEFEEETVDGRKVKSVCTFDGDNKLIHKQLGDKATTIVREFAPDTMVAVSYCHIHKYNPC